MKGFWKNSILFLALVFASVFMQGCSSEELLQDTAQEKVQDTVEDFAQGLPAYAGNPYVEFHENQPSFSEQDMKRDSFESYSDLDAKGRCGVAFACVGQDLMPQEKRGNISHIKPSGWQKARYDFVEGKNLYNRCHLIAHQLTGENANDKNLITGTRYFNVEGMLPFENQVADYVKETGHHVLYRVTPYYEGDNLVASGVQMEGYSVEDKGAGICFNVYVFNVQPGVVIDYATGESAEEGKELAKTDTEEAGTKEAAAKEHAAKKAAAKEHAAKKAAAKEHAEEKAAAKEHAEEKAAAKEHADKKAAKKKNTEKKAAEQETQSGEDADEAVTHEYVLNTNTKKFHYPDCRYVKTIKPENSQTVNTSRDELIGQGYDACKGCMP